MSPRCAEILYFGVQEMRDEVLGCGLSQVSSERRRNLRQDCLERVMVANRNIFFFRKGNQVAPP